MAKKQFSLGGFREQLHLNPIVLLNSDFVNKSLWNYVNGNEPVSHFRETIILFKKTPIQTPLAEDSEDLMPLPDKKTSELERRMAPLLELVGQLQEGYTIEIIQNKDIQNFTLSNHIDTNGIQAEMKWIPNPKFEGSFKVETTFGKLLSPSFALELTDHLNYNVNLDYSTESSQLSVTLRQMIRHCFLDQIRVQMEANFEKGESAYTIDIGKNVLPNPVTSPERLQAAGESAGVIVSDMILARAKESELSPLETYHPNPFSTADGADLESSIPKKNFLERHSKDIDPVKEAITDVVRLASPAQEDPVTVHLNFRYDITKRESRLTAELQFRF